MRDLAALERLLQQERALLLAGQYGGLGALIARKQALLDRIDRRGAGGAVAVIGRLQGMAAHNGRLLEAALSGLGAAQAQVEGWQRAVRQLDSYDARGQARRIEAPPPGVIRRA